MKTILSYRTCDYCIIYQDIKHLSDLYQILFYLDSVCMFNLFILQFHLTFWFIMSILFVSKTLYVWLVFRFRSVAPSLRRICVTISIFIIEVVASFSTFVMATASTTLLGTMTSDRCFTLQGLLQICRVDSLIYLLFMQIEWTHQPFNCESENIIFFFNCYNNIVEFCT